eukprot:scaffold17122_cov113-Isochrysis_galbana.AAC.6
MASRPAARVAPPLEHGRAMFGASTLTERLGMPPHALVTFGALHKRGVRRGGGVRSCSKASLSLARARGRVGCGG